MAQPSFPVNNNDVVEVRIQGVAHGSRVMTILHYRLVNVSGTSNDGWSILNELSNQLTGPGSLVSEYIGCLSQDWQESSLDFQVVYSQRWIPFQIIPGPPIMGSVQSPALPLQTSGRIVKRAIQATHHGRGVIKMPAVPQTFVENDGLSAVGLQQYQLFANQVKQPADLGAISVGLQAIPILFNRKAPLNSVDVFDAEPGLSTGTERRRLPGRGI